MGTGTHERESLLEKIRKLMRVTAERGATEGEAANAAAAVRKLLDAHNIQMVELAEREGKKNPTIDVVRRDAGTRGNAEWQRVIARRVARLYDCRILIVGRNLGFYGDETDCAVAAEVYTFIARQVKRLRDEFLRRQEAAGMYRKGDGNSFGLGCAKRVAQRIDEDERLRVVPTQTTALVVIKKEALDAYGAQFKPARRGRITLTGATAAGYSAGNSVRIRPEIAGSNLRLAHRG